MVSINSIHRCQNTLQDFIRGYFALHGLHVDDMWYLIHILLWCEASLYHLDEINEDAIKNTTIEPPEKNACWALLETILTQEKCWDSAIKRELESGARYWHLERTLCRSLYPAPSMKDVETAIIGKSFDYRVLHMIICKWTDKRVDSSLMDMLKLYEQMVETRDDISDYWDDEAQGSFNVLRMFCAMYGKGSGAGAKLSEYMKGVEQRYATKLKLLPDARARKVHEDYVRGEKGGVWLWDSIIPSLDRNVEHRATKPPLNHQMTKPVFSYSHIRRGVPLMAYAAQVLFPLLGLPTDRAPLTHLGMLALSSIMAGNWHRLTPSVQTHCWSALEEAGLATPVTQMLLEDGLRYHATLQRLTKESSLTEEDVWALCRLRSYDSLFVMEVIQREAHFQHWSDAMRALVLVYDCMVSIRADVREFNLTIIRDATGAMTLSGLSLDPRQLNTAVLLHFVVKGISVSNSVQMHMRLLQEEAETLLREVPAEVAKRFRELSKQTIGNVKDWIEPPSPTSTTPMAGGIV